jgi:integrase/recombinase XerC
MKSSFSSFAEQYLAMLRNERGASAHTLRAYTREVNAFAEYLTKKLVDEV